MTPGSGSAVAAVGLAAGTLPFWSPQVRRRLAEFDVLLVAGMKLLQQYIYHEPCRAVPEHVRLVQLDDDPWELNKNYPVEVGVKACRVGEPDELSQLVAQSLSGDVPQLIEVPVQEPSAAETR